MPASRLRLRLAAGFALAFGLGLCLLAAGSLGYLWRESHRRLDARLAATAAGVTAAMLRELHETPDSSMAYAAGEVRSEWPPSSARWVIARPDGTVLATTDHTPVVARVVAASPTAAVARFSLPLGQRDLDVVVATGPDEAIDGHDWRFRVLAFDSTEGIEQDTALLATVLTVVTPLLVLFSLGAGYLLAGRALRPARALQVALAGIGPQALSQRVPVGSSPGEITELAVAFNALFQRLEEAQTRNQRFVREAAHQIRTPLTLVLGEAELVRTARDADPARALAAIQRIQTAATLMRHRVDELMLLAEAQTGITPRLEESVELDGLALECTDLMRGRASALGRSLALGTVQPATVRGNQQLLREALLELLENGCRHAGPAATVTTEVFVDNGTASIRVSSTWTAALAAEADGSGLGMQIVGWIAQVHGGRFDVSTSGNDHVATLTLATGDSQPGKPTG
ncbi:MAG: HAMP domain-containing protein [Gemmatimonadetes bacterium]|nr:HAMP domain-containing protein [Gemmatimonadota bacterium]